MLRFRPACPRLRPSVLFAVVACAMAVLAAPAGAATPPAMPPAGKVLLGVGGEAASPVQFGRVARAPHELHLITLDWRWDRPWASAMKPRYRAAASGGYRLMIHLGAGDRTGRAPVSPGAVARGAADGYLIKASRSFNYSRQYLYVRPPAEMNGHWSPWAAFRADGRSRGSDFSPRMYRWAFVRMALIMRGGNVAAINRRLAANRMGPLRTRLLRLPRSGRIAMVWNPQGRGAPDVAGNQPRDFYPGRPWVDYVANDVYAQRGRAAWADNDALYARYSAAHPFMMAEYAPWGYDDPAFVRRMYYWAATHPRTVALLYFNGTSSTTFRLSTKPRSLAVYRAWARTARFRCPGISPTRTRC